MHILDHMRTRAEDWRTAPGPCVEPNLRYATPPQGRADTHRRNSSSFVGISITARSVTFSPPKTDAEVPAATDFPLRRVHQLHSRSRQHVPARRRIAISANVSCETARSRRHTIEGPHRRNSGSLIIISISARSVAISLSRTGSHLARSGRIGRLRSNFAAANRIAVGPRS